MRQSLGLLGVGLALGFVLSRAGFTSWDELHAMFCFRDLRLVLGFGAAVGIMAAAWWVIRRATRPRWSPRRIHRGTLLGGAIFGVGWALSGACPSAVFAALGEGQLLALVTLAGILAGNWLYGALSRRYLRWPSEGCADD